MIFILLVPIIMANWDYLASSIEISDKIVRWIPTYVGFDSNIIQINRSRIFSWSPLNHQFYPKSFKSEVKILYLCLKRYQHQARIPKFVIYIIVKFLL
jgi:hypothetical protein